jgi:RNA polymerase sigma-70 factor (ECF subfamily)
LVERNEASERALVQRARAGDRRAFGELVTRYMRRAYYAALGLVGSHEDALDLSQEAFARAFRARANLDPDLPFYGYLYQIVRRLCFNFLRDSRTRRVRMEEATPWLMNQAGAKAAASNPARATERPELCALVQAAIERLPEREREVLASCRASTPPAATLPLNWRACCERQGIQKSRGTSPSFDHGIDRRRAGRRRARRT